MSDKMSSYMESWNASFC